MDDFQTYDPIVDLPDRFYIMDNEKFQIYRDFCGISKWFTVDVDLVAHKLTTDDNFDLTHFIGKARSLGNVGCQQGKAFSKS